jgi:polysaccharide pyruvyl transferase WcaK-like protein
MTPESAGARDPKKEYHACLMGAALDTGNLGVSALAASLVKIIVGMQPASKISLLVGNRPPGTRTLTFADRVVTVRVVNCRLSPRARLGEHLLWILLLAALHRLMPFRAVRDKIIQSNPWLKTLAEADFAGDIRGGDSFSDMYGGVRFLIGCLPGLSAILLRKDLVLLPQTYGPFRFKISEFLARCILRRSSRILARDAESCAWVNRILAGRHDKRNVRICPDVAFVLGKCRPEKPDTVPPLDRNGYGTLIGVNVNGLVYNGGYTRNNMFALKCDYRLLMHLLVQRLLENACVHMLLIPHTFVPPGDVNSDVEACRQIVASFPGAVKDRLHLVARPYDQHEIKSIIGLCDFFIGSRMHACIAALSQGIPTLAVAYSPKFAGVFQVIGVEDMVIDARRVETETALEEIRQHFQNRERIGTRLRANVASAQRQIYRTFAELLSCIQPEPSRRK